MTPGTDSDNPAVKRRKLVLCSHRSHRLAVSEGFLAHCVGFLMFLHDDVGVIFHALLKPPSKVHDNGKGEKDEKGELPALQ
jgi:hypothetical protein